MYEDLLRKILEITGTEKVSEKVSAGKKQIDVQERINTWHLDTIGVSYEPGYREDYVVVLYEEASSIRDPERIVLGVTDDETEAVETARKLASALDINFKGLVKEGVVPNEPKDSEDEKIKKLTEQDEDEPEEDLPEEEPKDDEEEAPEISKPKDDEEEAPEIKKEYVGNTEDTHYYIVSKEDDAGNVEDLQIIDQEGMEKFSAKINSISIENVAEFLYKGIRELKIENIEFGIFDRYLYPYAIEEEEQEEEEEAPEELEQLEEEPEDEPIESKKNESVDVVENLKCPKCGARLELVNDWLSLAESKTHLIEMKITDHENNTFEVFLVDAGSIDTVIDINGKEIRFDSEFASMWKDEEGNLTDEGLKELALDALSNMDEDSYNELLARKSKEEEVPAEEPVESKKVTEMAVPNSVYVNRKTGAQALVTFIGVNDATGEARVHFEEDDEDGILIKKEMGGKEFVSEYEVSRQPRESKEEVPAEVPEESKTRIHGYPLSGNEDLLLPRDKIESMYKKEGLPLPYPWKKRQKWNFSLRFNASLIRIAKDLISKGVDPEKAVKRAYLPARREHFEELSNVQESGTDEAVSMNGVKELFVDIDLAFARYLTSLFDTEREIVLAGKGVGLELSDKGKEVLGDTKEGKDTPGVRDGFGPHKKSLQREETGEIGKRKIQGEACPNESNDLEVDSEEVDEEKGTVGFTKEVYEVEYEQDGETKTTRVMAFDEGDAKRTMEKNPKVRVLNVEKISESKVDRNEDTLLTKTLLDILG